MEASLASPTVHLCQQGAIQGGDIEAENTSLTPSKLLVPGDLWFLKAEILALL